MDLIYLDNAATTPLDPDVAAGLAERYATVFGNPSSPHPPGRAASRLLEESRERLAAAIGGRPEELIFTSGGTESLGTSIIGSAGARAARIAVTTVEHPAVHAAGRWLAEHFGWTVVPVPVGGDGRLTPEALEAALDEETRIVCIMLVNNEVGAINDVPALARVVRSRAPRARLVIDAVQALGKVPLDVRALDADCVVITAHKLHGPKGIGALWTRVPLDPILRGGGQERGLRGGTPTAPLAWGFAEAVSRHAADAGAIPRMAALRDRLLEAIRAALPGTTLTGPPPGPARLPNNAHVCIPGLPGEPLVNALAAAGICVSTGSACGNHAKGRVSEVLTALGRHGRDGAYLRLTTGRFTTEAEIDEAARRLVKAVGELREVYP